NPNNAQLLTNPLGKLLRINTDGSSPTDNPFYDDGNPATGNDDRIWAYGFRNPWDFTFSPYNDSIYLTENGSTANDEINFVRKGKNYGWPVCAGYCVPYNPLYRQPIDTIGGNGAVNYAPTGILVYNGNIYPSLTGKVITSNMQSGGPVSGILRYNLGNPPFNDTITSHILISPLLGTTLAQHTDGYIYMSRMGNGQIVKLLPDPLGINNNNEPSDFKLEQNYPNPFNPQTSISYSITEQKFISIKVFDIIGKEIVTLVNENRPAGTYEVVWNALGFPSGVYFYRLTAGSFSEEKKMVLLK
ncbi:MAG TPA: PQQ-dependent sugar dehydrogenase, partial [Ignavibacteria bacterium]|nr:PQQ-dependent sugar dehydrogenase [Ignavibacteria bacterium]